MQNEKYKSAVRSTENVFFDNIIKIKIHSSAVRSKIFVETRLCNLCVIHRSRVLRVVCPH